MSATVSKDVGAMSATVGKGVGAMSAIATPMRAR